MAEAGAIQTEPLPGRVELGGPGTAEDRGVTSLVVLGHKRQKWLKHSVSGALA